MTLDIPYVKNLKYAKPLLFVGLTIVLHAKSGVADDASLGLWVSMGILVFLVYAGYYSYKIGITDSEDDPIRNNENDIDKPGVDNTSIKRIQHYRFAHSILKDLFFEDVNSFIKDYLGSNYRLQGFWSDVGKFYSKQYEGVEELDGSGIEITAKETEGTLFVVISLPVPIEVPEAYFIGLIIPRTRRNKSRYITLELGEEGSVLCEWTQDAHLNYGKGPEPALANFEDKLIEMGDISAKTWDSAKPSYSGEEWMTTLWEWADTYDISPLTLPRSSTDLQAVEYIYLNFEAPNKPFYIPKEIGKLSNLHTFIMYQSKIKELPNEISHLKNLINLHLDGNALKKLPEGLCSLSKLHRLTLSENNLTSLPECMGDLRELGSLNLNFNRLEILPESMSGLKLEEFRLLNNPIKAISPELQSFINTTRRKDASTKEPYEVIWKLCDKTNQCTKRFDVPAQVASLPFFLSGVEVEGADVPLTEKHLLLGVLYGLNSTDGLSLFSDREILTNLVSVLSAGYRYRDIEEMILDVSRLVSDTNGFTVSRIILETGHKLIPESSLIIAHLIVNLWSEISLSDEDNIERLREISTLIKKVDLSEVPSDLRQLICYYGLCALIFIYQAKHEDYLESSSVDEYLVGFFDIHVSNELLLDKAAELMKDPGKYQPIDLWSPVA